MQKCKVCKTELPLTCFYKNKTYASGYTSKCKECHKAQQREGYQKYKPTRLAAMQQWQENNRGKANTIKAKYRASKLQATVSWSDKQYIADLYDNAKEASNMFGIDFQVDHIVPLQATEACGLHCEFNLQILTKTENCSKQNKMEVHV